MSHAKNAFTLIELLVVIAIIAILAAILFPVFAQAKTAAKKASSLSNMKQINLAMTMYANDSDDVLQPMVGGQIGANGWEVATWDSLLGTYMGTKAVRPELGGGDPGVLKDPSDATKPAYAGYKNRSYALPSFAMNDADMVASGWADGKQRLWNGNGLGRSISSASSPSSVISLAQWNHPGNMVNENHFLWVMGPGQKNMTDSGCASWSPCQSCGAGFSNGDWGTCTKGQEPAFSGQYNYAFADGHVKSLKPEATIGEGNTLSNPWGVGGLWRINQ